MGGNEKGIINSPVLIVKMNLRKDKKGKGEGIEGRGKRVY